MQLTSGLFCLWLVASVRRMFKAFEFCLSTKGIKVPAGPDWLHEVKHDGYRLRVEPNGESEKRRIQSLLTESASVLPLYKIEILAAR